MQPSQDIIDYIANTEGFAPRAYLDPPGNTRGLHSIGYGHQIQPTEGYLLTATLTQAQAMAILEKDVAYATSAINQYFKRTPSQGVYDGIFDLSYNAGPGAAQKVIATWNATGDTVQTANHAKLYVNSNGRVNPDLVARRNHDAALITGGIVGGVMEGLGDLEDLAKKKVPGSL